LRITGHPKYSIWLLPSKNDHKLIYNKIEELSKVCNSQSFQPHCTLFSPVFDLELAKDIIQEIDINPFQVKTIKLNQSSNIWKTVFIELEKNELLNKLHQLFQNAFPTKEAFKPHVSFIYKIMPKKERMDIIASLDIQKTYEIGGIAIVNTSGRIEEWKTVYEVFWN
jgi:2'-5' RNA ligase